MFESLKLIGLQFVDVLAPRRCMGCLREGDWLCGKCFSEIEKPLLVCVGCGNEQAQGKTCGGCKPSLSLTGAVSAGKYESQILRRGIHWLKFKGIKEIAMPLGSLMISRMAVISPLRELQQDTTLVPVPLHKKRLQERGFNQSLELCNVIGTALRIPVRDAVERSKKTWTQAKLPDSLRSQNTRGAFKIKPGVDIGQKIIIVDDVTTSGSTLDAVAKPLIAQGVKEVWGLTAARG